MNDAELDLADVWHRTLRALDDADMTPSQRALVGLARLAGVLEHTALVEVPNDYTKTIIEHRVTDTVVKALSTQLGREIRLAVTVNDTLEPTPPLVDDEQNNPGNSAFLLDTETGVNGADPDHRFPVDDTRLDAARTERFHVHSGGRHTASVININSRREADDSARTRLNPKYTFETFVAGSSNRFAHAAANAVAEAPAKSYNPLFIYGSSGLGKTHLLHAIGHYARHLYPHVRVRYVSSEEFTNDFINSIRDDRTSRFQSMYRDVDVLLIDDIQFLAGKEQTQEEFFHTFNALHNASKQVVITSDVSPKELQGFEERLRSRFDWGLITDVQVPDLETRIAILRKKAAQERMTAPDDVLEYIATMVTTNIRELEGALIRVTAFANLNRQSVTLALAEVVLKDLVPDQPVQITALTIQRETAEYFALTVDDLCSSSRSRQLVTARQIAMYLCRELTELSLPKIGQLFGGRDHTTVMHADRKIRELMGERRAIYNQVTELTARIRQRSR
ncbi:MAG: chromosomal replication initiator protein DnaA [Dermatophilaceae bacterium]|nr:chromosomal replication initiator protein DnaA [Dermatophilaceae bacterium]